MKSRTWRAAFDELVIVSNATHGEARYTLPGRDDVPACALSALSPQNGCGARARCSRRSLARSSAALAPRTHCRSRVECAIPSSYPGSRQRSSAVFCGAWPRSDPAAKIYAYSYWANDMALAVAMAKARGMGARRSLQGTWLGCLFRAVGSRLPTVPAILGRNPRPLPLRVQRWARLLSGSSGSRPCLARALRAGHRAARRGTRGRPESVCSHLLLGHDPSQARRENCGDSPSVFVGA